MKAFDKAKWIWNSNCLQVNSYAEFHAAFAQADTLRIACDGNYALYVNDTLVGFGQYPGYEDMQFYDEYALESYVQEGENCLRIVAHHPGRDSSTYRNAPAGVIFELWFRRETVAASFEETMSRPSPDYDMGEEVGIVSPQLGFTFGMDLTREGAHFTWSVGVDRSLEFAERPVKKLLLEPNAPMQAVMLGIFTDTKTEGTAAQRMHAAQMEAYPQKDHSFPSETGLTLEAREGDGCLAILDLGREDAGILSLDITVPKACELIIGWGEHLADGRVRTYIGNRNFAASIRLKAGRNQILNPLLRLGLRYLQIHIYAKNCCVHYAGIRPTPYPLGEAKPAPIRGDIHEKIYDTCVRTLVLCMHEHYEDCPWREQAFYSMDSRNQMLCGYHAFEETEFPRASLRLMAHSVRADGLLELCSPARVPITIPSFSAIFPVMIWEYLAYSGDEALARELLPTLEQIANMFLSRIEDNGLIPPFLGNQYWNFYEWQDGLEGYDTDEQMEHRFDAPLGAFALMGLDALGKICDRLEKKHSLYMHCGKLREGLQSFWNEELGCYASFRRHGQIGHYCELANALMLYAGAVPEKRISSVQHALMGGNLLPVTLSHSIFKYDALLDDAENVDWVLHDIETLWGSMLDKGATTFWETIEGESAFDNAGSLCHGWSAIPVHIYHRIAAMQMRKDGK